MEIELSKTKEQSELLFILDAIQERKKSMKSKKVFYRKYSLLIYLSTAILATITTILSGLKITNTGYTEAIRIVIMIITSLITLINTYSAFYHHKDLWIANNDGLNKFYKLEFDIQYSQKKSSSVSAEQIDKFKIEYQNILDELNESWISSRKINK